MSSTSTKTLSKRIPTKHSGVYYKEIQQTIIDDHGKIKTKIIDKVYVIRYRSDGKQHLVTLGKYSEGIREAYAKTKRDEYLAIARNGELPPQVKKRLKKQIITLDSIADDHYKYKALYNRNNDHAEKRYTRHIKPILGDKDITSLSVSDIEKLQQAKAKKYSPKTTNNIMGELSTIYSYAIKHGVVTSSPMKQIDKLKVDNKRERYLTKDEVKKLLETVKIVKDDKLLYTFVLLAVNTGARVGAICKLTAKDINFKLGQINMPDEKNAETYTCYLENPKLIEMLHKRIATVGEDKPLLDDGLEQKEFTSQVLKKRGKTEEELHQMILTDRVKHKTARVLNKLFNTDKTKMKDRVVVHTLRHSFASNLAINGVPILTIKKLMNHRDINQTLRYAKLAPDSGKDALKGLFE